MGRAPNPSKLEVVKGWALPTDRKQLESFLGLANYYREYVKGFAKVAAPLHALKGGGRSTILVGGGRAGSI